MSLSLRVSVLRAQPRLLPMAGRLIRDPATRRAIALVIGLRVVLGVVGRYAETAAPGWVDWRGLPAPVHGIAAVLVSPWLRDDAIFYQSIAAHGYAQPADYAFFPLYPTLCRLAGGIGAGTAGGALLVSTVCAVIALVLLDHVVRLECDAGTAGRAVLLIALFPYALFLLAPFTESLFLALSLGCFLALRRGHLGVAAGLAALAALTRFQGVFLALPLAVEAWTRWRAHPRPAVAVRGLAAVAMPGAACLGFLIYGRIAGGLPLGFVSATSSYWGTHLAMPWTVVADSLRAVSRGHPEEMGNLLVLGLAIATVPTMLRRLPPGYAVYAVALLVPSLFHENGYSPLMSAGRFIGVVFPVFIVFAIWVRRARLRPLLVASAVTMTMLFIRMVQFHFVG